MFGGKKKDNWIPTKGYILKTQLNQVRTLPIPEDLENWIEIDLVPNFNYFGKIYDIETETFIEDVEFTNKVTLDNRKKAYKERSDSLFMEWQYEQTPQSEALWRSEVAKIKSEFPKN